MKRRYKCYIIILSSITLFMGYVLWSAVQLHGTVPLGNGYYYWHTDAGVIVRLIGAGSDGPERVDRVAKRADSEHTDFHMPEAGPNVDGYHVYKRIIAGHVSSPIRVNAYGDPVVTTSERSRVGYFIIDVRDDRSYDGLSKQQWLKKLRSFGITHEPELYKPSIYDKLLGRNKPH